ncbi:transporter substrate-binding domain-containing protein [Pseudoalteromonas xiamenensis]|uniref:substrate-binding periplasmic protein n=1 Tax=Pseudoalteromonas xiamenensis TaxID=882626 RepID=UPI0027E4D025|nr:transporter substrate-binding domain-containing protein [Pseudoalteromonas xiamenensis]WMN60884.1 transporter substrate-binding domain-containing protein [Pseudoalteromonas xiamenensis]
MRIKIEWLKLSLFACLYSLLLVSAGFSKQTFSSTLSISVGWNKPPYVVEEQNSGFELEMVSAIFKKMGYPVSYVYVPFGRSNTLIKLGRVDAALTMNQRMDTEGLELSDPYISYQNAAISLKGRSIEISSIQDLEHYSIVGFQNASVVLGNEYRIATRKCPLYLELPDQRKQVELLLKGKVDFVIMDINIFNYLSTELMGSSHMSNVVVHRLFPKTNYHVAFTSKELMLIFNAEMKTFKQSDEYSNLVAKYEFLH